MKITKSKYLEANGLCMSYEEQLSYCEKQIERMNNSYFSTVDAQQYEEYERERDRLKAVIEALTRYKKRLGLIDDKGVILVED